MPKVMHIWNDGKAIREGKYNAEPFNALSENRSA